MYEITFEYEDGKMARVYAPTEESARNICIALQAIGITCSLYKREDIADFSGDQDVWAKYYQDRADKL